METIFKYYQDDTTNLSKEINKKVKIYLDTKYWVDICELALNKKQDNYISQIYLELKKGVESQKIICPISLPIFLEVLSQKDSETLKKTVEIIDNLSQGYILRNVNLLDLELYNFFYKILNIEIDEDKSKNYWDYIGNIFGFMAVKSDPFFIQKKYFEFLKTKKLIDIINSEKFMQKFEYSNNSINIDKFQKNKQKYLEEHNSFDKLYYAELGGLIEEYKNIMMSVYKNIMENKARKEGIEIDVNYDYSHIINLVYNFFKDNNIDKDLPTIDITAKLHAKLRWNKTQKYKKGDLIDIMHATCALPYYDYFFTERSLSSTIKECNYDDKYNCIINHRNEDILIIIKEMVAE